MYIYIHIYIYLIKSEFFSDLFCILCKSPDSRMKRDLLLRHMYSNTLFFPQTVLQVSLIQFLIENCLKIFGEDITSLFGENSVSCDNSDITDNSEISGRWIM